MNPKRSSNGFLIIILLLAIGIYYFSSTLHTGSSDYSYQTFLNDVKNEKVEIIGYNVGIKKIKYMFKRVFSINDTNALPEGKY